MIVSSGADGLIVTTIDIQMSGKPYQICLEPASKSNTQVWYQKPKGYQ